MNAENLLVIMKREASKSKEKSQVASENLRKLDKEISLKNKVKEILLKVMYLKKQEIKILEDVVNTGLKYSYPEKDLKFKLEFSEKNNRVVPEFFLNGLVLKPPFVGDGGGIISMVGLLLYITFVKLSGAKILLMDEVEAMVDINASKKLFEFLEGFSKTHDLIILAITHKTLDYEYSQVTDKIKLLKVGV